MHKNPYFAKEARRIFWLQAARKLAALRNQQGKDSEKVEAVIAEMKELRNKGKAMKAEQDAAPETMNYMQANVLYLGEKEHITLYRETCQFAAWADISDTEIIAKINAL